MHTTMELLARANLGNEAEFCRRYGLARTSIAVARERGKLSPPLAGAIATEIGDDAKTWIAIAAMENVKDSKVKRMFTEKLWAYTSLATWFRGSRAGQEYHDGAAFPRGAYA